MADPIKVLIADDMSKKAVEILSNAGFTVDVRTGMKPDEMTCAIPASRLEEVVGRLRETVGADSTVATYAGEDKRRFQ